MDVPSQTEWSSHRCSLSAYLRLTLSEKLTSVLLSFFAATPTPFSKLSISVGPSETSLCNAQTLPSPMSYFHHQLSLFHHPCPPHHPPIHVRSRAASPPLTVLTRTTHHRVRPSALAYPQDFQYRHHRRHCSRRCARCTFISARTPQTKVPSRRGPSSTSSKS